MFDGSAKGDRRRARKVAHSTSLISGKREENVREGEGEGENGEKGEGEGEDEGEDEGE